MTVLHPGYPLRPEIMESAYYLHTYTKKSTYRDMGRVFLEGLIDHCRVDYGYAALESVVTKEKRDGMESFFLAETMKYLYLLFVDESVLTLDEVVFNTEAHPFRKTW